MTIGDWMDTPQGMRVVGYAFSFGAAIVIVGALFKIQHWPGASMMLTAGMGTEAVLFALTAFANPHKSPHWEKVFPQLSGEEHVEIGESGTALKGLQNIDNVSSMSNDEMDKLSLGIAKLTDTAAKISDLSALAGATSSLVSNMTAASDSVAGFTNTQVQINASSEALVGSYKTIATELGTAQESTASFILTMKDVNKNLSAINSIYEIQLKSVGDQSESIKSVNTGLSKIKASVSESLKDVDSFKDQASKMAQQITSLNTVYGNMLNALSI